MKKAWIVCKSTVLSFLADEALSKGAAIAFYTVTSLVPVLLVVVAVAGLAFGREAAQNGIIGQLSGLMGKESAEFLQSAIANAQNKSSGTWAAVIGVVTLIVTASGVFGEMQSALNTIWKVDSSGTPVSRLVRARAASLGLVVSLGFLMMVSLVVSAGLTALGDYLNAVLPFGKLLLTILNGILSFLLISVLFAAERNSPKPIPTSAPASREKRRQAARPLGWQRQGDESPLARRIWNIRRRLGNWRPDRPN